MDVMFKSRDGTLVPKAAPSVLKRIIPLESRNALAKRSIQEKSINMKSSWSETTGDFFYVQAS
jgi:hypothetical protein